jgi:hypothetical protein
MAHTYTRTVTVVPADDGYTWSNPATGWIVITQVGSSDTWNIEVLDNATSQSRSATLTVNHTDGSTTNSITVNQAAGASGGVTPTPTPSSSTPGPTPTPTPSSSTAADSINVTFNNSSLNSFFLDDDNDGKGGAPGSASLTYNYEYSGNSSGALPTIVQKDSLINVTFVHGSVISGTTHGQMTIDSLDAGGCQPNGLSLSPDLIIAHPDNSNATRTLQGTLMQAFACIDFSVWENTSAGAVCAEVGSSSDSYSSADTVWQNGTILYVGHNGSSTLATEGRYFVDVAFPNVIWFNRTGGLGLELSTSQCSDFSSSS